MIEVMREEKIRRQKSRIGAVTGKAMLQHASGDIASWPK